MRHHSNERRSFTPGSYEESLRSLELSETLESLERSPDSTIVVASTGTWIASSVGIRVAISSAPAGRASGGEVAHQRFELRGHAAYAIGIPIPAISSVYYEVFDLGELDHTLAIIRTSLFGAPRSPHSWARWSVCGQAVACSARSPTSLSPQSWSVLDTWSTRLEPNDDRDLDRVITSFNVMVDALEQRMERDTRFVSDVSHELRSPLTTLSAATDVMKAQHDALSERGRLALDLLSEEVERLSRLVEDLSS